MQCLLLRHSLYCICFRRLNLKVLCHDWIVLQQWNVTLLHYSLYCVYNNQLSLILQSMLCNNYIYHYCNLNNILHSQLARSIEHATRSVLVVLHTAKSAQCTTNITFLQVPFVGFCIITGSRRQMPFPSHQYTVRQLHNQWYRLSDCYAPWAANIWLDQCERPFGSLRNSCILWP